MNKIHQYLLTITLLVTGLLIVVILYVFTLQTDSITVSKRITKEESEAFDLTRGNSEGFELFMTNCERCHNKTLKMDKIGPSLENVLNRRDSLWVSSFIKNNVALRQSGDKQANNLYEKFDRQDMPVFEDLEDREIAQIIAFLKGGTVAN